MVGHWVIKLLFLIIAVLAFALLVTYTVDYWQPWVNAIHENISTRQIRW